jgi:Ca2+/H+ antiporter
MSTSASWAVVIIAVINMLFIGVVTFALWFVKQKVDQLTTLATPVLEKATGVVQKADEIAGTVETKVGSILNSTEDLVENVAQKVKTTTSTVEETIAPPMIQAASLAAGVKEAVAKLREPAEDTVEEEQYGRT